LYSEKQKEQKVCITLISNSQILKINFLNLDQPNIFDSVTQKLKKRIDFFEELFFFLGLDKIKSNINYNREKKE
jgi:hypothetical protein